MELSLEEIVLCLQSSILKLELISTLFCLSELLLYDIKIGLSLISVLSCCLLVLDLGDLFLGRADVCIGVQRLVVMCKFITIAVFQSELARLVIEFIKYLSTVLLMLAYSIRSRGEVGSRTHEVRIVVLRAMF